VRLFQSFAVVNTPLRNFLLVGHKDTHTADISTIKQETALQMGLKSSGQLQGGGEWAGARGDPALPTLSEQLPLNFSSCSHSNTSSMSLHKHPQL
jgi:hypothetical protein